MKIKVGFVVGISVGYYLGAMAGRQRYEQLNRLLGKVSRSGDTHAAAGKARSAVDAGIHRATDEVRHHLHHNNGRSEPNTYSPS